MAHSLSMFAMLVSVFLMLLFIGYSYFNRHRRGVRYFGWVMACRFVYACGVLLELNSALLEDKLIYRNLEQTALLLTVPLVVLFVWDLRNRNDRRLPRGYMLFLSVFAAWAVLVWTNPLHHLIYHEVTLLSGHLEISKTVYALAFNFICYLILVINAYSLFKYLYYVRRDLWIPGICMLGFSSLNLIEEIVKLTVAGWASWLLPQTVYVSFFGMAASWFYYKYNLLSLTRGFVLESVQDGILIASRKGIVIDINKQVNAIFGGEGAQGRNLAELLERWPDWLRACKNMKEGVVEITADVDGEPHVYTVKIYPLASHGGRIRGIASILFDITEKQRHLERVRQLNRLNDQLFAAVSHDIRDPLAIQVSLMELLESDKQHWHENNRVVIEQLNSQVQSTYAMVEHLLEWFQIRKEGRSFRQDEYQLSVIIDEVLQVLKPKFELKQVEVRVEAAEDLRVYADREAVRSILRNLLSNAVKFSNAGGQVRIRAWEQGDQVLISVRDNGVGIEENRLRSLFDPNQFDSSFGTAGERGIGLGLHVCREFVRMCGGRIWADSKPGHGSAFTLSLARMNAKGVRR